MQDEIIVSLDVEQSKGADQEKDQPRLTGQRLSFQLGADAAAGLLDPFDWYSVSWLIVHA